MKKYLFTLLALYSSVYSQTTVDVSENTLKIPAFGEEIFYYGFAEGDQLIFNFQEVDNKELKEVEIIEYPSSSKFMDYKTKKIENKTLNILRTGIYAFRLSNSAITGRVCKIKIQRIPSSDKTKFFNTSVKWVDKPDTTWNVYQKDILIGYDTLLIPKTKKEILKTEQYEELIMEKNQRVHSSGSSNGNKSSIFFTLPSNSFNELSNKKVVSWAYWVGVGEEANAAWRQNSQLMAGLVKGVAGYAMSPLGGLLVGKITELALPKIGEDVSYGVVNAENQNLFQVGAAYKGYDFGKGVAGYRKFTQDYLLQGPWYIVLLNDNMVTPIDVNVKVIALIEKNTYQYISYTEQKITPKYEKRTFRDPIVKMNKVPVILN
jgi:hypothetical protein